MGGYGEHPACVAQVEALGVAGQLLLWVGLVPEYFQTLARNHYIFSDQVDRMGCSDPGKMVRLSCLLLPM